MDGSHSPQSLQALAPIALAKVFLDNELHVAQAWQGETGVAV